MSVKRRVSFLSQQRVDLPDLRSIESAASADFDDLIKAFATGTTQGYILRGFNISMTGAIGGAASGLQMVVDPGAVFHINASQSGTFYLVPAGTLPQTLNAATNTNVSGSFAPNAINYVGIDYVRYLDSTTAAQVYQWDPSTDSETTLTAPRAQILNYEIIVSTAAWPSNILPVAIVTTDAGNNVVSVTDCRWMFFRLGQGGANPNPFYTYPWTAGRTENPVVSSSNSSDPFSGGDKQLLSLKDWMDAIMSSIQEIKGTTYWYQEGSAGSISKLREDLGNTITTGKGTITHSDTTPGLMNWSDPILFKVIGSALAYQLTANPTSTYVTLGDDQVAYITLTRDATITPNLFYTYNSISNTTVVTSIGSISWTGSLAPGDFLRAASDSDSLYTQIKSVDSLIQVTLYGNYVPAGQTIAGQQSVYTFGTYNAVASPSTPRDIYITSRATVPSGQNVFWLFIREDNGGTVPRVYVRFLGVEIELGETDVIDDSFPRAVLSYIGSANVATSSPNYTSALTSGALPEIVSATIGAASTISSNQYFVIASSANARIYYVWFNKDGTGIDPAPNAKWTGVQVAISTGQTNLQVATAVAAALTGTYYPDFTVVNGGAGVLTITNNSAGVTDAPYNVNVSAPFAISATQAGTGVGNNIINDGDNLTLAIKKLDEGIGSVVAALAGVTYDEVLNVVSSGGPVYQLNNTGAYTNVGVFDGLALAYSFVASSSGTMAQIQASMKTLIGTPNCSVQASIYSNSAGAPGSSIAVSTNTISAGSLTSTFALQTFNFSTGALTSGSTYWVVFTPVSIVTLDPTDAIGIGEITPALGNVAQASSPYTSWSTTASFTFVGNVTTSGALGPGQIAPASPGTNITIPVNSRIAGSPQQVYVVGNGTLQIFLNGQFLFDGSDWTEVGAGGANSSVIQIQRSIVAGDQLQFRLGTGGGGGGFGGAPGPQGPPGPAGPSGSDAIGGPIAISTKSSSYSVMSSDNVLLANCLGGGIVFTLPNPSTVAGKLFYFKKIDSSSNPMQITATGGVLIDGSTVFSTNVQWTSFTIVNDGITYYIL